MKQFLLTMAGVFAGLVLFLIGVPFLLIVMAAGAAKPTPTPAHTVLALDLRDPLTDQQNYKLGRIEAILQAFPDVQFMLIGDDGERDPEVYAEIARRYPQQISGVWIRRVSADPKRARIAGQQDLATLLAN